MLHAHIAVTSIAATRMNMHKYGIFLSYQKSQFILLIFLMVIFLWVLYRFTEHALRGKSFLY